MSMTYYAVTDDPNELAHWGIKGMKWGVRHDKPRHSGSRSRRPRSAAYKKAQSKLGKMMKSGIKKAEANWKAYNSPEAKYNRQTNKAIQLARKGKLKYGKLSDEQVRRVTERLDLERQARQLSNQEQTFRHRLAKSIGEGVITGIGQGFGRRASEWIARGSVLKTDRLRSEQQDELDRHKEKRRIKNAEREAKKKVEREFEQQRRKDEYEHERDLKYQKERAANSYLYGAKYDNDGKLLSESFSPYYEQRYVKRKTLQGQALNDRKSAERQRRLEENNQKAEYHARVKRLEAAQNKYEKEQAAERARLEKADKERQRKIKQEWAEEIRKKEAKAAAEEAWRNRQSRMYVSGQAPNPINSLESERRRRIDVQNTSNKRKRKGRR